MADQAEAPKAREKNAPGRTDDKAQSAQPAEKSKPDPTKSGGSRAIKFREYYEILPDKPIPQLGTKNAPAYAARDTVSGEPCFAIICSHATPPRMSRFEGYKSVSNASLMHFMENGPVRWGAQGSERYALLFERNIGRRYFKDEKDTRPLMNGEMLMRDVFRPLSRVMQDMRNADQIHGSINAYNVFESSARDHEGLILGECVSAPPSYNQPVLFETVERGMADPAGRGLGSFLDDLYSLGVTFACIAMGRIPMQGMSDDEILRMKIEKGSYPSIVGREKFPEGVTELLRGLLNDDPHQRWQMDDLLKWIGGRRLSPKQSQRESKASRPYEFLGKSYWRARELAVALPKDVGKAAADLTSDKIVTWVKRSLSENDKELLERVAVAIAGTPEGGGAYNDKLVARVTSAMDPRGPIRYRGLSIFPGGFGAALCETMAKGGDLQPYAEIINFKMAAFWMEVQYDVPPDTVFVMNRFDNAAGYLRQTMAGYGLERCMYYLCTDAPCLSPTLKSFYVTSAESLVRAYEEIAHWDSRPDKILDRHSIAYLMARERHSIENQLGLLTSGDPASVIVGTLSVFADIQRREDMGSLPGLATWLSEYTAVMLQRIHNRRLREKLRANVKKVIREGDLEKMLLQVDNLNVLQEDRKEFLRSSNEYAELSDEARKRRFELKYNRKDIGKSAGREAAAVVSGVLSGIAILASILFGLAGAG